MVKKFLGSESIQRDEDDIICFDVGELDTNQELLAQCWKIPNSTKLLDFLSLHFRAISSLDP